MEYQHRVCECKHKAVEHRMTLDMLDPGKPMGVHECLVCKCREFVHESFVVVKDEEVDA